MERTSVLRFDFRDDRLASAARDIRTRVFVEEQGVPPDLEYDEYDHSANHYLLLVADRPVATARWRRTGKGTKLERFALLEEFRNQGLGRIILEAVMDDIRASGGYIYLHAQERAVSFYERYGFRIAGEPFFEAGIRHFLMEWPQDMGSSTQAPAS